MNIDMDEFHRRFVELIREDASDIYSSSYLVVSSDGGIPERLATMACQLIERMNNNESR